MGAEGREPAGVGISRFWCLSGLIATLASLNQINTLFNSVCGKEVHYPKTHEYDDSAII